jgi:hypothetical protein
MNMVPEGSRQTMREHFRQAGKDENAPEFPEEFAYLYLVYLELRSSAPLSYTEIESWARVTCSPIKGWEAEIIKNLDRAYQLARNTAWTK